MTHDDGATIHPTALIEADVSIGAGTHVWDHAHVRRGARIGAHGIIGEKTYVAYDVVIGDHVKVNGFVSVCAGVVIEDFCMIATHVVFTNERFPRAGNADLSGLATSAPTERTLSTRVCRGATIGANATIGPGVVVGSFAMVAFGAVVVDDVPAHRIVAGNPARPLGWACVCGRSLPTARPTAGDGTAALRCEGCGRSYRLDAVGLHLVEAPTA